MDAQHTNGSGAGQSTSVLVCYICKRQMRNPHMLPCLHVFCLACLQEECSQRSRDKFFCPICVDSSELTLSASSGSGNPQESGVTPPNNHGGKKSVSSQPWHSFDTILENEAVQDALQRRLAELPASERVRAQDKDDDDDDDDSDGYYGDDNGGSGSGSGTGSLSGITSARLKPPTMFPCSNHPEKLTDQFCSKCEQLACPKCISSFHRRCSQSSIQNIQKALESRRRGFDSLHNTIAGSLALCEEAQATQTSRADDVETTRSRLLHTIQTAREKLVATILAKEKILSLEVNRLMDLAKTDAEEKARIAEKLATSLRRQLDLLSFSIGSGVEGELLPLLPGLETRARADVSLASGSLQEASHSEVLFQPDDALATAVDASPLGFLQVRQDDESTILNGVSGNAEEGSGKRLGLALTLVTSFHGGARDDISEPLLTDLVLLTNGDVILTDRDNHCVKKFNHTGKLLTRVMLDASPVRIAIVSQGRAVVSTTSRRELYFLSLHGTVRVLSSVRVKKLYTFLTSLGGGMLAAGTNYGDCLDLITEDGGYVRTISSSKRESAGISRPFYVTPVQPLYQQGVNHSYNALFSNSAAAGPTFGKEETKVSNPNTHGNKEEQTVPSNKTESGRSNDKSSKSINNTKKTHGTSNHNNTSTRKNSTTAHNTISKTKASSKGKTSPTSPSSSSTPSSSSSLSTSNPTPAATTTTATSYSKNDLWVTDSARKILYRLRQTDGKTTFTLKSRSDLQLTLECPLGVTVHPSGLPLLVDRDSDSVLLLGEGGNFVKPVLSAADGLTKPCAIFAGHRGHVALSQVDGMVKIYSSKLQYI
ncbi:tripartite motif-containing protein 3-like [Elysia marginata]|uniref:Tripartite motif-containing protein 3-like n=1 Tax=Elysia marginata TaxID=1093978 RepID=A0AAV4FXH0_9GAST|nr:tripartite motif-containing protein 3-like [Elysia marginata]